VSDHVAKTNTIADDQLTAVSMLLLPFSRGEASKIPRSTVQFCNVIEFRQSCVTRDGQKKRQICVA
jgi:hypothetical protein